MTEQSLAVVEKIWKETIPEYPLEYTFVDQDYENLFTSEIRLTDLLKYFTILALIIASLGLYGLSSYATERRTNEIGVRKVMGADSPSVIFTMAREFLVLVLMALAIALPAGWFIVHKLLHQFAYRLDQYLVFVMLAVATLILAQYGWIQAYRAICINPATGTKTGIESWCGYSILNNRLSLLIDNRYVEKSHKVQLRSFKRQRSYIIINILGLSIGIACSLLITLFVINEAGYDRYNVNRDRIFRIVLNGKIGGQEVIGAFTPSIMGPTMLREVPEVEDYLRMTGRGPTIVEYDGQTFTEEGCIEADSSFFNFFTIPVIKGDPAAMLNASHKVVLTESTARKIFVMRPSGQGPETGD
jgi:hypothetical protein